MSLKKFIQLVEQAQIPNMQVLNQLQDGFTHVHYNGMTGVLDQQSNKMILFSNKMQDSYHIVTVADGRETTQYVNGNELGPATKKALDSITPRQRPRPPAPVQETYQSSDQVLGIVKRMMEDARVPQKPRQGPLRQQTGAGRHKDKKKDQKQGKAKHKGKELDEGRFGRHRDDQFSLGGRLPRTDRIDRDSSSGQDAQQSMERKLKQQTINRLLDRHPEWERSDLELASLPELIQMLREAVKKPNATTRHLRDYPVSDKDVAKPVKKPEKKKPEQGVAEGHADQQRKVFKKNGKPVGEVGIDRESSPGAGQWYMKCYAYNIDNSGYDSYEEAVAELKHCLKQGVAEGSGKNVIKSVKVGNFRHDLVDTGMGWQVRIYNGDELYDTGMSKNSEQKGLAALEDAVAYTEKQTRTKRQGVAEDSDYMTDNMVSHITQIITHLDQQGGGSGDRNTFMKLVARKMPRIVQDNPKLFRRAFGIAYDRFFHIDQDDDDFDYTDYSMHKGERGLEEDKQKGVDGKACWKGYKRMGTKKKGGRTVDNCVKMESISEGILKSFGLMEKSPPGFKGTVKAMKKHPELTKGKTKDGKEKNPWALAWHMKNKGYKSHKKADGTDKE